MRQPVYDFREVHPNPDVDATSKPVYEQGERLADPYPLPRPPAKDWRSVPLPPKMRDLPRDKRGYPIFFTVGDEGVGEGSEVDFRVLNVRRHLLCAKKGLCMLCGKPLNRTLWFCGGPMCVQNRVFGDGPMHESCLRYAMQVCPYLVHPSFVHHNRPEDDALYYGKDENVILNKPERICLYTCQRYELRPAPGGKPVYIVEPARTVEWYHTDGTYIARTHPTRYSQ